MPCEAAALIAQVVNKLSDAQWEKIIDTAISTSKQKKETIPAQAEEVLSSSAKSDFELADDDEKEGEAELVYIRKITHYFRLLDFFGLFLAEIKVQKLIFPPKMMLK
jgi:hypothetical protein